MPFQRSTMPLDSGGGRARVQMLLVRGLRMADRARDQAEPASAVPIKGVNEFVLDAQRRLFCPNRAN